jgi:hypothetical protein
MTQKNQQRGEKRGVLSTGRAQKLGKTKRNADAESDRADEDEDDAEG